VAPLREDETRYGFAGSTLIERFGYPVKCAIADFALTFGQWGSLSLTMPYTGSAPQCMETGPFLDSGRCMRNMKGIMSRNKAPSRRNTVL
jgi:hypothetical protein